MKKFIIKLAAVTGIIVIIAGISALATEFSLVTLAIVFAAIITENALCGAYLDKNKHSKKYVYTPFETFLSIAYELDRLAFDIDPYEYQDNEGTESIQTVAENLLHDAYRASVVAMLKEQHRYFSIESAMGQDYANAAERSHSILKRLTDIFGEE